MDVQLVTVGVVLTAAVAYLVRASWRTWAGSKCGSGCGKCAPAAAEPAGKRISLPQV